jgi:hypothetical protein
MIRRFANIGAKRRHIGMINNWSHTGYLVVSAGYLHKNVDFRVSVVCRSRIPARSRDVVALGGVLAERKRFSATRCLRAADAADQFPPALKRAAGATA